MKKILILNLALLLAVSVFSQDRNPSLTNGVFNNNLEFFALQKIQNKYNNQYIPNTKGRYRLFFDWKKCSLTTNDDKTLVSLCNYNLYTDEFELKIENDIYFIEPIHIKEILVSTDKYIPLAYKDVDSKEKYKNYYNLIAKGQTAELVERYKLKLKNVASKSSLGLYESMFEIKKDLFFKFNNGNLIEVPRSTKKVIQVLNLNQSLSNKYKKTNLKKLENLILLIEEI